MGLAVGMPIEATTLIGLETHENIERGFSNAYIPSLSFTVPDHLQGFQTEPLSSSPEIDDQHQDQTLPPKPPPLDNIEQGNVGENNNRRFLKSKRLHREVKKTN
ncbi:hypothetical protein V6N12_036212 [Hibiscus sabdariffa]|uniref:Uncharacterized protein n=1 Tax=Hibiscus sabdariffa TaxID=183260 RepID=A0ABR2EQD3_9ROSI